MGKEPYSGHGLVFEGDRAPVMVKRWLSVRGEENGDFVFHARRKGANPIVAKPTREAEVEKGTPEQQIVTSTRL
jgi:hypothetical protein